MAPKDYYAIVEGYNNKKRKESELLRLAIWASKSTWENSISFSGWCDKFFPLWSDERQEAVAMQLTPEQTQDILNRHKKYHGRPGSNEHHNRGKRQQRPERVK